MSCSAQKNNFHLFSERRICSVLLFMSLLSFTNSGYASWKKVAQFNVTVNASFFFNEQRGFVGLDGNNGIKRTYNGGKTWLDCIIPPAFYGYITDIFMRDSLNGWVGIENDNNSKGLWYTVDGGVTWNVNPNVTGQVTSVYQTPTAVIFGDRFSLNRLSVSTNGGGNFTRISTDRFNGINFVDDLHGVATVFANSGANAPGTALYSADGGNSWSPTSNITVESWAVYAQKGTPNFVIAGEKVQTDPNGWQNVYGSSDYGITWQTIGVLQGRTTGHIAGVGPVMYTQSWTVWQYPNPPAFVGMNRSTDGGKTWVNVGGPSNFRDTRFSVTGCLGGVVYAFDEVGNVWKTTDGGDGSIHEPPHNPNFIPDHIDLASTLCNSASADLTISNLSCNPLRIESVQFIDSTDPAVASGALAFTRYPTLPDTLSPASSDFMTFHWDPKILGLQTPLSTTYVKVHSSMLNGSLVFDTLFAINSQSFANKPIFSLSTANVKFDSMNICQRTVDTTISIKNGSCDTLWLDSTIFNASADWQMLDKATLSSLQLPIGLAPGESTSFVIRFTPSGVGGQGANVILHFSHQGVTRDTSLFLAVKCYRVMNVLADDIVSIPPTSICAVVDTTIYFHNFNCDTLTIDGITNNNSTIFSDISGLGFPYKLEPGGILAYHVRYHPVKNQKSFALVVFQYHLAEDTTISESTLQGNGLPGTSIFGTSTSTNVINFSDRDACSPEDSIVFTIVNPGCDSLSILSSSLTGLSLPGISYKTEPSLPKVLADAGDKVKVTVYLQADKPSSNNGALSIKYSTSDGLQHDSVFSVHGDVFRGARVSSLSQKALDLGTGSLCIDRKITIDISNPGCPNFIVKDISIIGQYYALKNARPTPFDLAQGESEKIQIVYNPTSAGTQVGQLQILTNTDVDSVLTIPLTATTTPIDHVTFKLVQENTGLKAGDTAVFALVPDNDWKGEALQRIDFSITTNGDLLTYAQQTSQTDPAFQTIVSPVSLPGNLSQLNVQLKSPIEIVLHKNQPLVSFYFKTALTQSFTTPVSMSLLSLNDADPHYLNCILSPLYQDGNFVLDVECGSKTLLDFLNGKLPILADGVRPNPVTSLTNYQAMIPFSSSVAGTVEVDYFDALGKSISTEIINVEKAGKYFSHFDASQLSGGSYQYVLKLQDGSLNPIRGRVVVLK